MHYVMGGHGRMQVGAVILVPRETHRADGEQRRAKGLLAALSAWLLGDGHDRRGASDGAVS